MINKNGGQDIFFRSENQLKKIIFKFLRLKIRLSGKKKKSAHQKNVELKLEKNRLQKGRIITQRQTSKIKIRTKRPFKN